MGIPTKDALFAIGKVPTFLDRITHRLETRDGGEIVKVLDLVLRVQPFDFANARTFLDENLLAGVLFNPQTHFLIGGLKEVVFDLDDDTIPNQNVVLFATPATKEPSIAFRQLAIGKVRARIEKAESGWGLVFHATFGPVGREDLEYINAWYTESRCLTWSAAQASMLQRGEPKSDATSEPPEPDAPSASETDV